jgi:nucleotide-binding universal stress UspA family protein
MIALAESSGAKLLMVARDPARSTIIGTFLGSIADQVLRRSTVPVCIVRRPAVGKFYHRVLVPIAGDELYRRAVAYAVTLAQAQEATLIFCTIGGDPRACEERLSWAHSYAKEHNVVAEQRTIGAGGKIGDAICQQAGLESCDAIVMATHGRSGLPRLIEGSTAEAVVHSSDVPVLVVK